MLFLSFTNLTSVGLSDITPVLPHARSWVMIEQVAGLMYVALVISRIVGLTIARQRATIALAGVLIWNQTRLPSASLERFQGTFGGDVILPTDPRYDDARRVWNGADRSPPSAFVVKPTDPNDVIAAVRMARENDLPIAIRGGGHSLPGLSTCDDGMVLDLSRMRGALR